MFFFSSPLQCHRVASLPAGHSDCGQYRTNTERFWRVEKSPDSIQPELFPDLSEKSRDDEFESTKNVYSFYNIVTTKKGISLGAMVDEECKKKVLEIAEKRDNEEVIVFTREEFSRFYNNMQQQIEYINNIDLFFDRSEDWKLLGYWPKIMEIYTS